METFNIVLTGALLTGTDFATAVEQLAALTRLDSAKVERLLAAGKPTVVKKGVSPEVAEQYRAALTAIGVAVELQPCQPAPVAPPEPPKPPESPAATRLELEKPPETSQEDAAPHPPPPPSESVQSPHQESATHSVSVGAAPRRNDQTQSNRASADSGPRNATPPGEVEPVKTPASHGWQWVKAALAMFLEAPWRWMGMMLVFALIGITLSLIPLLGNLLSWLVCPVLTGGLMYAAERQSLNDDFTTATLFEGFSRNRNQLLLVGALYILGALLLGGVMVLIVGIEFWGPMMGGNSQQAAAMMAQHPSSILLGSLVVLLLLIPGMMAFWFAPCLVALENLPAWDSLKLSLRATLKNWAAFLVYGLVFFLLGAAASMLFGLAAAGLGSLVSGHSGGMFFIILLLIPIAGLPAMAVTMLSYYTGFRDIFPSDR